MAPLFYQLSTALVGEREVCSSTWQRTWDTKNTSLNAYFKWTDYSLTGQQSWSASWSPLYHFSLLYSSTFPVKQEEWFTLSSLSSHSSGRAASQFKVLIPGYVLATSSQDYGATLECAQAVVRHLSLLTEWFRRVVCVLQFMPACRFQFTGNQDVTNFTVVVTTGHFCKAAFVLPKKSNK